MWTDSLHPEKGNGNVKRGDSPQGKGSRVMVQPAEIRGKRFGTARKNEGFAAINSQSDWRV